MSKINLKKLLILNIPYILVGLFATNFGEASTYTSKRGLMRNYIYPLIGDMKLDEINPRVMDRYFQSLLSVKAKIVNNRTPKNEYLTVHTVREIHKLLRNAFNQAVKWEMMSRNPVANATLPKEEHEKREIWTAETLMKALEVCDDEILALAINLAFSCSLRMGEMLGLTWDCIDISEKSLKENSASIFINKELQRVNRDTMEKLDSKDVIFTFPKVLMNTSTALVLKTPKTKTSVRKVFLPNTVAQMLVKRKEQIEELKELFGDEYLDYNLVFANSSGRPMEGQVITRALKQLIRDNNLPDVVFHSFRHASITYKLKWNGGDMKSVQGDSGHARMDMSRFGRDYLQVGMYTEIMFPEHDIHFIAVNDGVDSTQGDNEFTPFRNIINEWCAKDTSKKIRAVMKVKGNAGEHLATMPPYGYIKSSDDRLLHAIT